MESVFHSQMYSLLYVPRPSLDPSASRPEPPLAAAGADAARQRAATVQFVRPIGADSARRRCNL